MGAKALCSNEVHNLAAIVGQCEGLSAERTDQIASIGDPAALQSRKLALFSSVKCPGDIILKTFDLAQHLRDQGVTVIGGFHSPMEQECLRILLRGKQPVIWCPARSIERMVIRRELKAPLDDGRLLILSPFEKKHRRQSAELAAIRNRFVAAVADAIFIAYASPGGKIEQLAREAWTWKKPIYTFASPYSEALVKMGAVAVEPDNLSWFKATAEG